MKKPIFILLITLLSMPLYAQFAADDLISVRQKSARYNGYTVDAYEGLFSGGHPFMWMRQLGGTPAAPAATIANRLLGTVIYGAHDGQKIVQPGRISVTSTGNFAVGRHPVKMHFQLGGGQTCCGTIRMTIDGNNGNVGIGTAAPRNKLDVNGTVRSREVRVEVAPWPDYVFEEDYELPQLSDTEKFILENKHLPEIPAAKEVAENGIALGEMNAKLLQKIEELTLYTIDQEKSINQLTGENQSLKSMVEALSNRLLNLEKLQYQKK